MPRLDPVSSDDLHPLAAEVFERFAAEGREPIMLYRVLANAPLFLRSYSAVSHTLRNEAEVPRDIRELLILRTAQLVRSQYEWAHHTALGLKAGVAQAKIDALAAWRESPEFDARDRAALQAAEEIHELGLTDATFALLLERFSQTEAIELVTVAAFYQMVARLIQAFGIEIEPEYEAFVSNTLLEP